MPKVKRSKKPPPDGWELIEPTLDELDQKMREGELYYTSLYYSKETTLLPIVDNKGNEQVRLHDLLAWHHHVGVDVTTNILI